MIPTEKVKEVAQILTGTREFANMKQAKNIIDNNKELFARVEEFKRKEKELHSVKSPGRESGNKAVELERMFDSLSKIPQVDNFLRAEKEFNKLLIGVFKVLNDSIELGLRSK